MIESTKTSRLGRGALVAILGAAVLAGGWVSTSAAASKPPAEWDGLARQKSKRADNVYMRPNVSFKGYTTMMIDPAVVEFDKDWDPNDRQRDLSRRISPERMQEIKTELGALLIETFRKELEKGGYQVVTTPTESTLRLSPAIVNLYINAPDTMSAGRGNTYVMDAGHMTLFIEFRDSVTGQLLARAVDTKQATDWGTMQVANSVTNTAEARNMLSSWARALVKGLDAVHKEDQ